MLLVLPISTSDWGLAASLMTHIKDLGPYDTHRILVLHTRDSAEFIDGVVKPAQEIFPKVDVLQINFDTEPWPKGPNNMFAAAAVEVARNPDYKGGWYFFEADNTPQHAGWLSKLEEEYNLGQKPHMGAVVPTRALRNGIEVQYGEHMVGTGIYPKDFAKQSGLFVTLKRQAVVWDIYLQWEILPLCTRTNAIQHIWNVQNVRRRGKKIICSPGHANSQPVPIRESALVVHGVKDGSLMRLLQESTKEKNGDSE